MTHDELLDTIGHWNWIEPEPLLKALRAVVELHKPIEHCKNSNCHGPVCSECGSKETLQVSWPCPTIEAVEKELND